MTTLDLAALAAIGITVKAVAEAITAVVGMFRQGPQSKQPKRAPNAKSATTATNDSASSGKTRTTRRIGWPMAISILVDTAFLLYVAIRPGQVTGLIVVAVALAAVDLYGTAVFWILGGNQRALNRLAAGDGTAAFTRPGVDEA